MAEPTGKLLDFGTPICEMVPGAGPSGDRERGPIARKMDDGDVVAGLGKESSGHDEHENSGEVGPGAKDGSGDCTELFLRHLSKKTNIYETDASTPLTTPWTFWVDRTQPGMGVEEFEASLRKIKTVYSVHVFWGVYCNIPKPSDLHDRSSLHVTRDDRKPIWEEEYNSHGGTFRIRIQKKDTDKVWRELLMAAVGEQFVDYVDPDDEVCGISVSIREHEDIILIWNKDTHLASKARIFECVHLILPDTHVIAESYKPHDAHQSFKKHKVAGYQNGRGRGNGQGRSNGQGRRNGHGREPHGHGANKEHRDFGSDGFRSRPRSRDPDYGNGYGKYQ